MTFAGRRILVTGAASGIGAATAALLAGAGARVVGLDLRQPADPMPDWIVADLADPSVIGALSVDGPLHGLVNAAGLPPRAGLEARILRVNFLGLRALTEALIPVLVPGASIVSLASRAGVRWRENLDQVRRLAALSPDDDVDAFVRAEGIDPVRAYDLSKEAVIAWTKGITGRLIAGDLRANTVSPAAVDTPILDDFVAAFGERARRGVELTRRAGTADEIARVATFLCHPDSAWIRGCNIEADGGLTAQLEAEGLGLVGDGAAGAPG